MSDLRLQKMAKVLIHYSLKIKPGERLTISAEPAAAPLLQEMVRETLRAGGHPELLIELPGVREIVLKEGSDEQLSYISPRMQRTINEYEKYISIMSSDNTSSLSGVDPARVAFAQQAARELGETVMRRYAEGTLGWCVALYPTNAFAQNTNMSLADFEDFAYHTCLLDTEDPVAAWQEVSQQQQRLIDWLKGKRSVHLSAPGTDLTLSIEDRIFLNDDGQVNFPGGEFFTGPVEDSANGHIRFSFPTTFNGRTVEDVTLHFVNGKVVEAHAAQGQDFLEQMLNLDEGARRLGEFAFGNNQNADRITKNILFDEKMGGTIHLALGASYPQTGGVNQSALHWDMISDLRTGSEIRVDGELFCKDGKFVV